MAENKIEQNRLTDLDLAGGSLVDTDMACAASDVAQAQTLLDRRSQL